VIIRVLVEILFQAGFPNPDTDSESLGDEDSEESIRMHVNQLFTRFVLHHVG